jgi:outer membrane lipoprotein SlyB
MVDVNTQTVKEESSSRGARTAKTVGGGAALGTIIGAIAGHGKGAAIGAVAGAAAGAGAEILTKGQRVKIPSETRLTFSLEDAVHLH